MVAVSSNLNVSIVGGTHSILNLLFKEIMENLESKSLLIYRLGIPTAYEQK